PAPVPPAPPSEVLSADAPPVSAQATADPPQHPPATRQANIEAKLIVDSLDAKEGKSRQEKHGACPSSAKRPNVGVAVCSALAGVGRLVAAVREGEAAHRAARWRWRDAIDAAKLRGARREAHAHGHGIARRGRVVVVRILRNVDSPAGGGLDDVVVEDVAA